MGNKRHFERFDLPLVVAFRPVHGSSDYSMGLMRNFSSSGLSLIANDSSSIQSEELELSLRFPQGHEFAPFPGNVVWKRESGDKCIAGIKLGITDSEQYKQMIKMISSYANIPVNKILNVKQVKGSKAANTEKPAPEPATSPAEGISGPAEKPAVSYLAKEFLKGGNECRVTFRLPRDAAPDAHSVTIAGDFNDWDVNNLPMTRHENGDFVATIDLTCNREYKFRYLIDGNRWENDWKADKYIPNSYGSDDSVVIV